MLNQTLSSPRSFTPISNIAQWTVLYCTRQQPRLCQARDPLSSSSPSLALKFSLLSLFATLLSYFPPSPLLSPKQIFYFSLSLWCSVFCKHHKRQCSLSPFFLMRFVVGEQSRAGPCARCLCSRTPLINPDFACLSVSAAIQSTPSLISFFLLLSLFDIFSYLPFFVSFFPPLFLSFFFFKGTKLGQLAWTPKKKKNHHAPLFPPNPLATFTQISQQ